MDKTVLLIEAFYGGSHKQLIDLINRMFPKISELHTMSGKKWHWRSLTSALHFMEKIPVDHNFRVLFTSSVLPLADLLAVRPDLTKLYKVVYFHENQFIYPVQERKQRYFQHGYNEILTCLAADKILFNSEFNKESFLGNISSYLNIMPDYRPKHLDQKIRTKCDVMYFPIDIPDDLTNNHPVLPQVQRHLHIEKEISKENCAADRLHIVWPHRWEHDKDPETFFSVMYRLKDSGHSFSLSVIGESFTEKPKVFEEAQEILKDNILSWGFVDSKTEYYRILQSADVVVSTAKHEFFGVAMLEATGLNCYPLCPNRLAYPEIYPEKYLYNTPNQLYKRLKYFCKVPNAARHHKIEVDLTRFSWEVLKKQYSNIFTTAMV